MRTSQVRRFVLSFSLLALAFAPCLSTHAPVASADPTWLPVFDDEIVASATVGGTELRIVPAAQGQALANELNVTVTYDRLDATLSNLNGATSVRTDGGYIAGATSLAMLGASGLTDQTDLESDIPGLDDARRHD